MPNRRPVPLNAQWAKESRSMDKSVSSGPTVCMVAIVRDELPFLDEWLAYHRLLGVSHFILYDDDPKLPLEHFLAKHSAYVTVVPWYGKSGDFPGLTRQTKAYTHALERLRGKWEWVGFLDIDEFLVLKEHSQVADYLGSLGCDSVTLHWHVFGHNGFYNTPDQFITAALTRRMLRPGRSFKSISRVASIEQIPDAHTCVLTAGSRRVDGNGRPFRKRLYPGKTDVAWINHYICRSFLHWMARPERGSVIDDVVEKFPKNGWKHDRDRCLETFVKVIAREANEHVDTHMLRFEKPMKDYLHSLATVNQESRAREPLETCDSDTQAS